MRGQGISGVIIRCIYIYHGVHAEMVTRYWMMEALLFVVVVDHDLEDDEKKDGCVYVCVVCEVRVSLIKSRSEKSAATAT